MGLFDEVNKKFMLNKSDIGLLDKLEYFRKIYPYIKLRLSIALKLRSIVSIVR